MGATVDWPTVWTICLLVISTLLAIVGAIITLMGIHAIARDRRRQKLRHAAWRSTIAMLNKTGLDKRVVIHSDRNGSWRCTVNRRHGATECDGYHINHDDL